MMPPVIVVVVVISPRPSLKPPTFDPNQMLSRHHKPTIDLYSYSHYYIYYRIRA